MYWLWSLRTWRACAGISAEAALCLRSGAGTTQRRMRCPQPPPSPPDIPRLPTTNEQLCLNHEQQGMGVCTQMKQGIMRMEGKGHKGDPTS